MSQRISKYHLDVLILLLSIWSQVPLIIHLSLDNNLLVLPRSTINSILNSRLDGQMGHQVNSPSFNSRFPVILFKMCTNVEKSELKTENAENNWQIVERETDSGPRPFEGLCFYFSYSVVELEYQLNMGKVFADCVFTMVHKYSHFTMV